MPAEKMSERRKKLRRPRRSSEDSEDSSSSESSSVTSSSSDEETDAKDLKPIKEYMSDRKELASQLFKSVKQDKIVMMLPQILRKVDLSDLEELCASELTGMSKTRISSIINGKEMLESSNTDDTDDSGPSLEIISDTEWLSDDDIGIKVEGGNHKNPKNSKDGKKSKKKSQDQKKLESNPKLTSKVKGKVGRDGKTNVTKVKLEKVKTEKVKTEKKEKQKEKEGESLLDLLELEMRARAIRALIRKEEGTSNSDGNSKSTQAKNSASTASTSGTSSDQNVNKRQANLKEQLEKIDVLMKHGDDEDVFVVIQPAPTIELLSTDSENEDHSKRVNQRLVSERKSESENVQEKVQSNKDKNNMKDITKEKEKINENKKDINKGKDLSKDKGQGENSKKVEKENENFNLPMSVSESNVEIPDKPEKPNQPPKEEELEEGEILDNDDEAVDEKEKENEKEKEKEKVDDSPSKTIKKIKRNTHIRSRKRSRTSSDSSTNSDDDVTPKKKVTKSDDEKNSNNKGKDVKIADEPIEIEESPKRKEDTDKAVDLKETKIDEITKIDLDDDKSLDIEEIINLDDYPDDIEDLEKNDSITTNKEADKTANSNDKDMEKSKDEASTSHSETWASRYYQQDDVQNVIKESKIQSEIRKRLRERQRLSKLNNSPKLKEQTSESSSESTIPKPTGSVEEYLALKGLPSETSNDARRLDDSASNDSTNLGEDSQSSSESKTMVEAPVVIVKKAKLNENAAVVKRIESSPFESLHKLLKCEDGPSDKSGIVIKDDLMLTDKKVVVVKAQEKTERTEPSGNVEENVPAVVADDSRSQEQTTIVEKAEERDSPMRDDGGTPKSDSSEDNIIVKIGDTSSTADKPIDASSQEASGQLELQAESTDPTTSELRPD